AGLAYNYYEATIPSAAPSNFAALTPVATGFTANFDLSQAKRSTDIGLVFGGLVRIDTAGTYTFFTLSDDGSQLFIDDVLVVDNDGYHGVTEKFATKELAAGYHRIAVTFFQGSGPDALEVD